MAGLVSNTENRWNSKDFRVGALYLGGTKVTSSAAELNIMTGVTATATEINRATDVSGRLVAGGSALTLTQALHDGKTVLWDTAAGTTLTLPAASGSGTRIRCVVSVTATSNSHIVKVANASDMMVGSIGTIDTDSSDATLFFAAEVADAMDTITLNRSTTGLAAQGDWVELEDIATNRWAVRGVVRASGVVATPFSSAV